MVTRACRTQGQAVVVFKSAFVLGCCPLRVMAERAEQKQAGHRVSKGAAASLADLLWAQGREVVVDITEYDRDVLDPSGVFGRPLDELVH